MASQEIETQTTELLLGRVKWFNTKSGYGFITATGGVKDGSDIFVHHSSLNTTGEQYRYLVEGEYVSFHLADTPSQTHDCQAVNVSGVSGGKLMCETRNDYKQTRNEYKSSTESSSSSSSAHRTPRYPPRSTSAPTSTPTSASVSTPRQRAPVQVKSQKTTKPRNKSTV